MLTVKGRYFSMSKQRREELKKAQQKIISLVSVLLVVIIAIAGVLSVSINKCDDCNATIFGKGYYKEKESEGVLGSVFGSLFGDTEGVSLETVEGAVICLECAKNNTSVKAELRDVSEFKR